MREICDRQFLFLSVPAHAWTQITQVALKEYDCIISISLLLWAIAAVLAAHDDAVMAQVLATLVARVPAPVVHELATAPALDRAMLAAVVPHVRRVVVADLADPHLKGAALVAAIWTVVAPGTLVLAALPALLVAAHAQHPLHRGTHPGLAPIPRALLPVASFLHVAVDAIDRRTHAAEAATPPDVLPTFPARTALQFPVFAESSALLAPDLRLLLLRARREARFPLGSGLGYDAGLRLDLRWGRHGREGTTALLAQLLRGARREEICDALLTSANLAQHSGDTKVFPPVDQTDRFPAVLAGGWPLGTARPMGLLLLWGRENFATELAGWPSESTGVLMR